MAKEKPEFIHDLWDLEHAMSFLAFVGNPQGAGRFVHQARRAATVYPKQYIAWKAWRRLSDG